MNDFWHMAQHQAQRKQVLMAEAEQSRLALQSRGGRKRTMRVIAPVMFRVGGLLMNWGSRLQAQYGELSESVGAVRPLAAREIG